MGKKFAVMNFGGNCAEGKWNMLQAISPWGDYVVASDLLVTGVSKIPSSKMQAFMNLKKKYDDLSYIKDLMEKRLPIKAAILELLKGREKIWNFAKDAIKKEHLRQTKAVYSSNEFPNLKEALVKAWKAVPEAKQKEIKLKTEEAMCDVETFCNLVGGEELVSKFKKFRIGFVSTKSIFPWDKDANGLSFNFLGWRKPPCDLTAIKGTKVPQRRV